MGLDPNELFPEVPNLYEFPSIHAEMIYDEHRVNAYKNAINRTVKNGDVVVDIGTGTGLLAFLCLQSGAKHVHAIDRSPIIESAKQLAKANGYENKITFYNNDSRETEIEEKADVMVSELIGHIAFEEGMVESLFDAKTRFVKPDGSILPESVTLYAAPVYEKEVYQSCIDCWKPVNGIDYSIMRDNALRTSYLTEISQYDLLAEHQPIFFVDFTSDIYPKIHSEKTYKIHRNGAVNGVALWFDSCLAKNVNLSSGPWSKTHWMQCFAPIPKPIDVNMREELFVTIDMKLRNKKEDKFYFTVDIKKKEKNAS